MATYLPPQVTFSPDRIAHQDHLGTTPDPLPIRLRLNPGAATSSGPIWSIDMATVGLNFGSATSGAGFDVATTVTAILAAQQAIETPWQTQLTALQAQDTVFSTLGTDLSTLTTSLQSLTDATGVLAEKQGSSSDTNVLELTSADTTAVAGSHSIVVNSLAVTASTYSTALANASDKLSGSVTIDVQMVIVLCC